MRLAIRGIAVTALLALSGAASAAITWDWSFSDVSGDTGSGTLTTNGLLSGSYLITGITGTWDGSTITSLRPASTFPYSPTNDNLLFSGIPQLDFPGFYFTVAGHPGENIFYTSSSYYVDSDSTNNSIAGTFAAVQAPEIDATFAASGVALLVGGLLVLRGRKQQGLAA